MTKEQYEKYRALSAEVQSTKKFLEFCGKKYKNSFFKKYRFAIGLYKICNWDSITDNLYEIPLELQDRIIEVVENYVEEKELEMEKI